MKLIHLGAYAAPDTLRVRFRPAKVDRLLEGAALLPLLADGAYLFIQYRRLGEAFPSDCFTAFLTFVVVFCALFGAGYAPLRSIRFPFRVGPHNVVRQYLLALRLGRVLNIVLGLMFFFGTLSMTCPWADAAVKGSFALLCVAFAGYYWLAWRGR